MVVAILGWQTPAPSNLWQDLMEMMETTISDLQLLNAPKELQRPCLPYAGLTFLTALSSLRGSTPPDPSEMVSLLPP